MSSELLTSVVIPTFGRPDLLRRAVDSVLAQTSKSFELIIVVDGGDKASASSVKAIHDARISIVGTSTKIGPGGARNMGAMLSKGQWIAFLDDDDEWHPEKLEQQLAFADSADDRDKVIIMTQSVVSTPQGEFVWPTTLYDNQLPVGEWLFDRRSLLGGGESFLQTSSLMLPRSLFDILQFPKQPLHEDWEMVLRAVKYHGYRLLTVEEPLVTHYVRHAVPSLSQVNGWRESLAWGKNVGDLLTPRAFAGFCLVTVARTAAAQRDFSAIVPLLNAAYRLGQPTMRQLIAFTLLWILPDGIRRRLRAAVQAT
jgi:glycosyltransferase involved in cell wall biosynthesis